MIPDFDFKEQSTLLMKRIWPKESNVAPAQRELARSAIEIALREAFGKGTESARAAGGTQPRGATTKSPVASKPAEPRSAPPCDHDWEEAFLDGRSVGSQCTECGVLQKDVQDQCNHFFVRVGSSEVCVACRKPRRAG